MSGKCEGFGCVWGMARPYLTVTADAGETMHCFVPPPVISLAKNSGENEAWQLLCHPEQDYIHLAGVEGSISEDR